MRSRKSLGLFVSYFMAVGLVLVVSVIGDDLADFEFESAPKSNIKQFDYYDENVNEEPFIEDFVSIEDADVENQKNPFDVKEKFLRTALVKALTNKALRQKFVEVTPILRVLSSQQRLALSALISAQISAKPGTELKLDQVRAMFGDSKKLILPLVFDIANLVRNAAKSSLHFQYELFPQKALKQKSTTSTTTQAPISRRILDLIDWEDATHDDDNGGGAGEISMEGVIDAQTINHELTRSLTSDENHSIRTRTKRSAFSQPLSLTPDTQRGFHERKLNISSFAGPNENTDDQASSDIYDEPSDTTTNSTGSDNNTFHQVEDLALADLNGTEFTPKFNASYQTISSVLIGEELPSAERLIAGPRIRKITNNKIGNGPIRKIQQQNRSPIRPRPPVHPVTPKSCERFTASMCIRANDYPTDQIMGSIRRHKHAMTALLAEYRDKAAELEYQEYLEEINLNKKRREDQNGVTPGGMCTSIVRYARPQKARSASGEWKFIVNTGQHTQTLRLEKCSQPQESCSYLSDNYRSRCIQVYNYHRLLSWDKNRGLHVDIFKIPSCCSCHVDGYREQFPPLGGTGITNIKDYTPIKSFNSANLDFGNLNEDIEYEEDDDDTDIDEGESVAYKFANGFKRIKPAPLNKYDANDYLQSSSSNFKNRFDNTKKISPTLGSFLSPPHHSGKESDNNNYKYNRGVSLGSSATKTSSSSSSSSSSNIGVSLGPFYTTSKNTLPQRNSRRPTAAPTSLSSYLDGVDDRSDQEPSGTDTVKPPKFTSRIKYTSPSPYYSNGGAKTSYPTNGPTATPRTTTSTTTPRPARTTPTPTTVSQSSTSKRTRIQPLFSTKLTNVKLDGGNKRINYNYHPIIDFFEDTSSLAPSALPKNYVLAPNRKSSTIKDRRIGLSSLDDSHWHPIIGGIE